MILRTKGFVLNLCLYSHLYMQFHVQDGDSILSSSQFPPSSVFWYEHTIPFVLLFWSFLDAENHPESVFQSEQLA